MPHQLTLFPVFSIVRHLPSSVQSRITSEPLALIWNVFFPFGKFIFGTGDSDLLTGTAAGSFFT